MNSVANVLLALCLLHPALTFGDERPDLQQIQDVVQRFYEAWNQQDFVVAEDLIGESVVELDMRSRQEPQTWLLRKVQSREEFLDGIVVEWTGGDAWDYDPEIHQYIKKAEFFDILLWGDRAMAITQEHLVGVSGPVGDKQYSAYLLDRADDGWEDRRCPPPSSCRGIQDGLRRATQRAASRPHLRRWRRRTIRG